MPTDRPQSSSGITNPRTVADRAANYLGMWDWPRTSVKTGPRECVLVVPGLYDDKVGLFHYDEASGRPRAAVMKLTARQAEELVAALTRALDGGEQA